MAGLQHVPVAEIDLFQLLEEFDREQLVQALPDLTVSTEDYLENKLLFNTMVNTPLPTLVRRVALTKETLPEAATVYKMLNTLLRMASQVNQVTPGSFDSTRFGHRPFVSALQGLIRDFMEQSMMAQTFDLYSLAGEWREGRGLPEGKFCLLLYGLIEEAVPMAKKHSYFFSFVRQYLPHVVNSWKEQELNYAGRKGRTESYNKHFVV